ncbi:MAG: GON domain-containing protein, partial [Pseudonocardiaceae bacterium]
MGRARLRPTGSHSAELTPATFADVHAADPTAPDGTYTLLNGGKGLTLYCFDMAGTPREYVTLVNTGTGTNFSQYTAGGASPGTDVRTTFSKLRIYPATLTVDIGDLTFATSTGSLDHAGSGTQVTSMPYGVAMSCTSNPDGLGNIDLRGTSFTVADTFDVGGAGASGSATPSSGNKVIDLTGGGFCGWITPDPPMFNPFNPQPGNFALNLADNAVAT